MSNKVLRHPDKEEIIKKLLNGASVKETEAWLSDKYPRKKRLHISYMTLQKFRKEHLNVHGEVLEDIKQARVDLIKQEDGASVRHAVINSTAYQDKINQIAEKELDVTKKLLEMDMLVSSRLEYYFNLLAAGGSIKEDKIFLEYLNAYKGILQDWKKYVDGVADKTIEHNINVTVMNDQINILKNVVFEVLSEIDPSMVGIFIERVNNKLNHIEYDSQEYKQLQTSASSETAIDAEYEDATYEEEE